MPAAQTFPGRFFAADAAPSIERVNGCIFHANGFDPIAFSLIEPGPRRPVSLDRGGPGKAPSTSPPSDEDARDDGVPRSFPSPNGSCSSRLGNK
jgi:hypothetical protein